MILNVVQGKKILEIGLIEEFEDRDLVTMKLTR